MIYFHRGVGLAYACDARDLPALKERLREALGDKFVEGQWDTLSSHGGALRIKAHDRDHLDISLVFDINPNILA